MSFDSRFSNDTFGPGSDVVSIRPGSYVNESANGSTRDPGRGLSAVRSSELPAVRASAVFWLVLVATLWRVSPAAPRSEKSRMSLPGGALEIVGHVGWSGPG